MARSTTLFRSLTSLAGSGGCFGGSLPPCCASRSARWSRRVSTEFFDCPPAGNFQTFLSQPNPTTRICSSSAMNFFFCEAVRMLPKILSRSATSSTGGQCSPTQWYSATALILFYVYFFEFQYFSGVRPEHEHSCPFASVSINSRNITSLGNDSTISTEPIPVGTATEDLEFSTKWMRPASSPRAHPRLAHCCLCLARCRRSLVCSSFIMYSAVH
mmetsp:Transcript_12467/g.19147  ORF Transcript_12467/g.19147 Transcript_12467/m.19147 type:complete len:215 (+) Transcript_12467:537-1181(+)